MPRLTPQTKLALRRFLAERPAATAIDVGRYFGRGEKAATAMLVEAGYALVDGAWVPKPKVKPTPVKPKKKKPSEKVPRPKAAPKALPSTEAPSAEAAPDPSAEAAAMLARIERLPEALRGPLLAELGQAAQRVVSEVPKRRLITYVEQTTPGYLTGWFHRDVCERLERFSRAVTEKRSPRLILCAPPRSGKSKIVSRRFPVWHLGLNPTHEIICCSYGQDLANKASNEAREIATQSLRIWPHLARQKERPWNTEFWQVAGGGSYQAVGMGGPITGAGAHVAIIDDYVKNAEEAASPTLRERDREWYKTTFRTRLAPGGGMIVMATRWTHDDLIGFLTDENEDGHEDWDVVIYPAIAEEDEEHRKEGEALHPERFPLDALESLRGALGERIFAAMYQQRPSPAEGALFLREWLDKTYDGDPQRTLWDDVCISIDATFGSKKKSADYCALAVVGRRGPDFCLIDLVRKRLTLPELVDETRLLCQKHPQAVTKLVERAGNGDALIQTLEHEIPGLVGIRTGRADKETRANRVLGYFRSGNWKFPQKEYCSLVGIAREELAAFPFGAHDDIVDAITQALGHWVVQSNALARSQNLLRLVQNLGW